MEPATVASGHKTCKEKLQPTPARERALEDVLRRCRELYNAALEQRIAHGGIVFVDDRTIAQQDVGGLIRALLDLIATLGDSDWENRIAFLRRVR
jgi:hypothetical protein